MRRVLAFVCVMFVIVCFIVLHVIDVPPPDYWEWEWEDVRIVGEVVNKELRLSEWGESLIVTVVPIEAVETKNGKQFKVEGKILCHISDINAEPLMGSVVKVSGKLKAFERASNPGQFDSARFYQILKIDFRLLNAEIIARSDEYSRYRETLYQVKRVMGRSLDTYFSEVNAGTLRAILLGERGRTDSEIKSLFQRNGIVHILTISGLHISIIGMGFYNLLRRMLVPLFIAAPLSMGLMISYGIMTNMSASSFRAIVMFSLRMLAGLVKRTYDLLTALGISAVLLLIEQPLYLYHSGFLFSFLAVLAIGLFVPLMKKKDIKPKPPDKGKQSRFMIYRYRFRRKFPLLSQLCIMDKVKDALLTCLMISIFTLPIYFLFYYEFPLYSVILNLIIIPPMTLVMINGLLTMMIGIVFAPVAKVTAFISGSILDFYEWACRISDSLPYNNVITGKPEIWQVVIYALALLAIVFTHKKIRLVFRYMILVFAVSVMLIRMPTDLVITFLDVGQGEAVFIATPDRRYYLIDGGSGTVGRVGEYRILPFLKSQGVSQLDGWFITHAHADHYAAFPELVAKMEYGGVKINNLILPDIIGESKSEEYKLLEELASKAGINTIYLGQGQRIAAGKKDDISFYCINPVTGSTWQVAQKNPYSLVLLLEYGEFSLLLTGDVEGIGERQVFDYLNGKGIGRDLTVLNVAHHGSRNSTGAEFLALTKPGYAVISAGYLNSYGHPHRDLLSRLADIETEVYITYKSGAITIKTDGERMGIETFLRDRNLSLMR